VGDTGCPRRAPVVPLQSLVVHMLEAAERDHRTIEIAKREPLDGLESLDRAALAGSVAPDEDRQPSEVETPAVADGLEFRIVTELTGAPPFTRRLLRPRRGTRCARRPSPARERPGRWRGCARTRAPSDRRGERPDRRSQLGVGHGPRTRSRRHGGREAHLPRQVVELRPVQTSFAARRARLSKPASDDGSRGTGRL